MLTSEPLSGYALASRLAELKSQNALIVSLAVGDTNAQWVIGYHSREAELGLQVESDSRQDKASQPAPADTNPATTMPQSKWSQTQTTKTAQAELW